MNTFCCFSRRTTTLGRAAGVWLFLALAAACSDSPAGPSGAVEPITGLPRLMTPDEVEVTLASNAFAFDLARRMSAEQPDSSFFFSPLSLSMTLGMVMNGADGETWDEMRDVLGYDGLGQEEINASYRGLLDLLLDLDPTVETVLANAAWIRSGFEVTNAFRSVLRTSFDARVETLDFADPSALDVMNRWASEVTDGLIPQAVRPPIDPDLVTFLMNATFFRARWTTQFDPSNTGRAPFHLPNGDITEVDMMRASDVQAWFGRTEDYTVADLPYGGGAFAMTVLVPHGETTLADVVSELDGAGWSMLVRSLDEARVRVSLPRFTLERDRSFREDLEALGMQAAFDAGRADFSRMSTSTGTVLDRVDQTTIVRVDEEGTVAAAVTTAASRPISEPPTLNADRPFLFAIRDRFSGVIFFLGAVVEPPEA